MLLLNVWIAVVLVVTIGAPLATWLLKEAVLVATNLAEYFDQRKHDMKYIAVATTLVFALALAVGVLIGSML